VTGISSNVEAAKKIAARLVRRNQAVAKAERNRDLCLYKFLESVHKLDRRLRNMPVAEARKTLKPKHGVKLPAKADSGMFAIKITHPSLAPKACSKYAAVLRLIRKKKKPGQSIGQFVRANGNINGCVAKEKQLRDASKRERGSGKRQTRR
jgi:hypothetical protein